MRGIMMLLLAFVTLVTRMYAGAHGGARYSGARVGIGLSVGGPGYWGGSWWGASRPYYYNYYNHYSPAVVVVPRLPLVFYDERGRPVPNDVIAPVTTGAPLVFYDQYGRPVSQEAQASAQPQPASATPTWLFCAESQSYYPYVQSCASSWQRVMPFPPPQ